MNIVCDIETVDLRIDTTINLVGFYGECEILDGFKYFILPEDQDCLNDWVHTMTKQGALWCGHNFKFDTGRLLYSLGIDIRIHHDTQVLAYLLSTVDELKDNRGKWIGLKYVAPRYLGVENWDISLKDKTSSSIEKVIPYLEKDCLYCYQLLTNMLPMLPKERRKTYRFMIGALNAYKQIEQNGLPLKEEELENLHRVYTARADEIDNKLKAIKDINYNSPIQLQAFLYEELELPILELTKKGQPSTKDAVLKELKGKHPIIDTILEKREVDKFLAFLVSWKEKLVTHEDGTKRLHSSFNMCGTVTGRTSSSDVNLQQVPSRGRGKELKRIFDSTSPGWQLVQLDYSQIELRFAGIVAGVKEIKEAYRNNADLHTRMGSIITGKPEAEVTKEERSEAKPANFGYLYGMSAQSFVEYAKQTYGIEFTLDRATEIRQRFFEAYPELLQYYEEVEFNILNTCKLTSIMSREYTINPMCLANPYNRHLYIRPGINFPVQSAASDYVLSGVIEVCGTPSLKPKVKVCATVHDSVIALIKEDNDFVDTVSRVKQIMEAPRIVPQLLTKEIDIPIIVDIEIGPWGNGISLEEYIQQRARVLAV